MTTTEDSHSDAEAAESESTFNRLVVGVDGSEPGFEACRQAARLAEPGASVEAVAVVHLAEAIRVGFEAPRVADRLQEDADAALDEAMRILGQRAAKRSVDGYVTQSLLHEIERAAATVVVVGSHGHPRSTEILIGGVAGELLHEAPCSVLIARPARDPGAFPRPIVVGMDGSEASDAAFAAAQRLATRFDGPLRVVTALQGKNVDPAAVRRRAALIEEVDEHPVEALVAASSAAGIVVVGSRGLHGLRALGSVSERVAHQATCSVLVVRSRPPA